MNDKSIKILNDKNKTEVEIYDNLLLMTDARNMLVVLMKEIRQFKEIKTGKIIKEITPDDVLRILTKTNQPPLIRDTLELIPEGKEANFKDAICMMVSHREHKLENIERMRNIAKRGGFVEDFETAHELEKWQPMGSDEVFLAKSNEDLALHPNLNKFPMVICDFEGITEFADLTKLPKKMIIKGDIDWRGKDFEKLPDISETVIGGNFICDECVNLKSLDGAPEKVGGDFSCFECTSITSLNGSPKTVGKNFICRNCKNLNTLEGAPNEVGLGFSCSDCPKLTTLTGAPQIVHDDFVCNNCSSLKTLKGAPKKVGGSFICVGHSLTSIKHIPKVGRFREISKFSINKMIKSAFER